MVVRATSPKVPICGRPDGPEPVSNSTSSLTWSFGFFFSRATIAFACSNGQALDCSASARKSFGLAARSIVDIETGSPGREGVVIAVIASEAKQSMVQQSKSGLFRCARNNAETSERADGKITQPQIGEAAFFPDPEQRPV